MVRLAVTLAVISCAAVALTACAEMRLPVNSDKPLFDAEKAAGVHGRSVWAARADTRMIATNGVCAPAGTANFMLPPSGTSKRPASRDLTMRYSPGDRFNLFVPGSPEFAGDYMVNADGRVIIPFAGEMHAVGLSNAELSARIETGLIRAGIFKEAKFLISVRPVQYAPINVSVSGAVFLPGRFVINNINAADKGEKALAKFGDSPIERFVAAALRAGGGVRPDADLSRIQLKRGKKTYTLNWQGAISGGAVDDVPLLDGDHIFVAEAPCFQSALVRPSQITPPGVRIFMSSLAQPTQYQLTSTNTAGLPYGTRLLAGLVAANCVGGSRATNAGRHAVLISRNPKTSETEVIQRSIEDMVLSPDRDTVNPYLMPDDSIACYDSAVTDAKEIAITIQTLLNPVDTVKKFSTYGK
jgi:polysaccharide biosynthesis/export protein